MIRAEQITGAVAHHGEGPVWDIASETLHWVDMLAGDVLSTDGAGTVTRRHVDTVVAALRPRAGGGMVIAVERGFAITDPTWSDIRVLPPIWSEPGIRMNEGGCDPQGRFYCGTMAYDNTPGAGALYRLDPDGRVGLVLDQVTCSNGLVWSKDGTVVYYTDTATQRVDRFDFDGAEGTFDNRRPVVAIEPSTGNPDGMAIDADGGLWVAIWDGGAVHRYTPEGLLDAVIQLPTPRVTACTFGGTDLTELFITTSCLGLAAGDPAAGALFVASPGVRGLPALTYAG